MYDFDDGTPNADYFGYWFGEAYADYGVGEREVNISGGDSGGPAFIDGKIAGIHSFGTILNGWGGYSGDTRVSHYASWIDAVIADTPQISEVSALGNTLVISFYQTIDSDVKALASAFTVKVDGKLNKVKSYAIDGEYLVLTLTNSVNYGENITLSYRDYSSRDDTRNVIQNDANGADLASFTNLSVQNLTPEPPPAPELMQASINGNSLSLAFDSSLDANVKLLTSAFTVKADGKLIKVTGYEIEGNSVNLTLSEAVTHDAAVTFGYRDYSSRDDSRYVIQTAEGGVDLASISNVSVSNNTPEPPPAPEVSHAMVDGNSIVIAFDSLLDATVLPRTSAFSVKVDGKINKVTNVAIDQDSVILTMSKAMQEDDTVLISYKDYTSRDDSRYVIQTAEGGVDLASFSNFEAWTMGDRAVIQELGINSQEMPLIA